MKIKDLCKSRDRPPFTKTNFAGIYGRQVCQTKFLHNSLTVVWLKYKQTEQYIEMNIRFMKFVEFKEFIVMDMSETNFV